jgi:hypothetical protein
VDGEPTLDPQQTARIAATDAKDRHSHRLFLAMAGLALLGLLVLGYGFVSLKTRGDDLSVQQQQAATAAQQLAQQVRGLGATPVVQPPPGAPGQQGAQGIAGQPGVTGQVGIPGSPGTNGASGEKGDKGDPGSPGSTGPSGPPGIAGEPGANGLNGSDGDPGAAGAQGEKGDPGASGADGQPPAGWTATYSDGSSETCTRADSFDAASPQYTCTISPPTTTPILPFPT